MFPMSSIHISNVSTKGSFFTNLIKEMYVTIYMYIIKPSMQGIVGQPWGPRKSKEKLVLVYRQLVVNEKMHKGWCANYLLSYTLGLFWWHHTTK